MRATNVAIIAMLALFELALIWVTIVAIVIVVTWVIEAIS